MRRAFSFIVIMACIAYANPVAMEIVSEFQVAPTTSEQIEFRYFEYPLQDTIINDTIPLQNTLIITPAGSSIIDTPLYLPGMGYAIIDESVLSGNFGLPDDSGYIGVPDFEIDYLYYPSELPAPQAYYSAAKFHFFVYDSSWSWPYELVEDWYIDSTPTFGQPNDDYPGCIVTGHVYDHQGQPLSGARVTATAYENYWALLSPPQFNKCCTTYTTSDGSYLIDSLLPWYHNVSAYADGYTPDTQLTAYLRWSEPITVDFYLLGIGETEHTQKTARPYAFPNPFYTDLYIMLVEPTANINLYDITGKLCMKVNNENLHKYIHIDCSHLPEGIYFLSLPGQRIKVVKL